MVCSRLRSALASLLLVLRLLVALPIAIFGTLALLVLVLFLFLNILWLGPLALLVGLLLPREREATIEPMALHAPAHVVLLGGGGGLTRRVALECVRRGADVTILGAESDALSETYELMKTTSLERQASTKQQLRCSPLDLTDGPMACFVALQNVLELVGKIDAFVCHPAELEEDKKRKSGTGASLTLAELNESILCCVWAVRAVMFPMQRLGRGRVLVLGSAPSKASAAESMHMKLAIMALVRSLRAEMGEFNVPVSLAAPLGSDVSFDAAGEHPEQAYDHGLVGCLTGLRRERPRIETYARHVVSGMSDGAPYILSPGGDGVLLKGLHSTMSGGCMDLFGHRNLTPAVVVLQVLAMPMLALLDSGLPMLWREALSRCFHRRPSVDGPGYTSLEEDQLQA